MARGFTAAPGRKSCVGSSGHVKRIRENALRYCSPPRAAAEDGDVEVLEREIAVRDPVPPTRAARRSTAACFIRRRGQRMERERAGLVGDERPERV
jgi:hypothetical protein